MATGKQKAGRKYSVDSTGITSLEKDFVVIQDAVMAADGEVLTFAGVPAIGSAHPKFSDLIVKSYDVKEGERSDKGTLVVTVKYEKASVESNSEEGGSTTSAQVEQWGWDDGTDEKELTTGADGTPVVNSAGDPFETVPKVTSPAPVFTKVMNFQSRQGSWMSHNCTVNGSSVTIGGMSFDPGTLLCTVCEKRLIGNEDWKYQYTVRLRYKSNKVSIGGEETAVEIGWDVAVADAGMREIDENDTELKLIRVMDKETGKMCAITSPVLLDGEGKKLADGNPPYNFRVIAFARSNFPAWFTSEPTASQEGK